MKVSKGFKWQSEQFGSRAVFVEISHEELGLPDPRSPEDAIAVFNELSKQAEAMTIIENVKLGRLRVEQISDALRPWITQTPSSTTTEPA